MSVLEMLSCDGCGWTPDPTRTILGDLAIPDTWFEVKGPATLDEVTRYRSRAVKRHACSPSCLAKLGEQLAERPDAIQPGQVVEVDDYDRRG